MPTVLIADDEVSLRRLVRATITSEDYVLLEAANGDVAWELIQAHRPEVVLLDVMMPGRTGLELARLIRATPALVGTHIILLTANSLPEQRMAGRVAGADVYLTKPFSPLQRLERLLGSPG